MKWIEKSALVATFFVVLNLAVSPQVAAQAKKPNIVIIMSDDVGI